MSVKWFREYRECLESLEENTVSDKEKLDDVTKLLWWSSTPLTGFCLLLNHTD